MQKAGGLSFADKTSPVDGKAPKFLIIDSQILGSAFVLRVFRMGADLMPRPTADTPTHGSRGNVQRQKSDELKAEFGTIVGANHLKLCNHGTEIK